MYVHKSYANVKLNYVNHGEIDSFISLLRILGTLENTPVSSVRSLDYFIIQIMQICSFHLYYNNTVLKKKKKMQLCIYLHNICIYAL